MTQDTETRNGATQPRMPPPNFLVGRHTFEASPTLLEPVMHPGLMEELEVLIGQGPTVPTLGKEASDRMRESFASIAADIRSMAKKRVDEALALQQEAESYASVILNAGDVLCKKIEQDATRVDMASKVVRKAQEIIEQTPAPE